MEAVRRTVKFGLGGLVGAGIGLMVGGLLAPQQGEELQRATRALIEEARRNGEAAAAQTRAVLVQRFRAKVDDPGALSDMEAQA